METQYVNVVKDIYDQLEKDPRTKKCIIEVSFSRGVVTLSGNVKDTKMMAAAEEIARSHPGVISVVNELKIG